MTKYDAYKALATELAKPQRDAIANHLRIQRQVGQRAQTVVQHEGWQTFLDHLEEYRRAVATRRDRHKEDLLKQEDILKRGEYMDLTGELRGLDIALALIPGLVERGREAGKLLETSEK